MNSTACLCSSVVVRVEVSEKDWRKVYVEERKSSVVSISGLLILSYINVSQ